MDNRGCERLASCVSRPSQRHDRALSRYRPGGRSWRPQVLRVPSRGRRRRDACRAIKSRCDNTIASDRPTLRSTRDGCCHPGRTSNGNRPAVASACANLRWPPGKLAHSDRKGARHRPGERLSGAGSCALMGQKNRSRHLPTSERWLAGFPRTDKDAHDAAARRPERYHVYRTSRSADSGDSSGLSRG
jgi:hypothetical protein